MDKPNQCPILLVGFVTFGDWRQHEEIDKRGAVAVTYEGDVVRIAVERCDVLLDPV